MDAVLRPPRRPLLADLAPLLGVVVLGVGALGAQQPATPPSDAAGVQQAMLRAFRGAEDPAAHGFADLAAVGAELDRVRGHLELLPAERVDQGRFFVDVRRADVLLRQGRLDRAAEVLEQAIAAARAAGCWRGSYRALALVLFEQCAAASRSLALLEAERDYLESGAAIADADWLELPLRLLLAELAFQQGRDRIGMQRLQAAIDEFTADLPQRDPWRQKAVASMAWQCVLRGDLDRAELYLAMLPVDQQRYPRGLLALRRGDLELAERAGRALVRQGSKVTGWMLVGEARERRRDFDQAEAAYRQALAVATEVIDRAIAERSLGDCELGRNEGLGEGAERRDGLTRAGEHYRAAQDLLVGAAHAVAERVGVLARLGRLAELRQAPQEAVACYTAALQLADGVRAGLASDVFGGFWLSDEERLEAVDGMVRLAAYDHVDRATAFAATEQGLARTLLDWTERPPRRDAELDRAVVSLVLDTRSLGLEERRQRLEAMRRQAGLSAGRVAPLDAVALRRCFATRDRVLRVTWWAGAREVMVLWDDGRGRGGAAILLPARAQLEPLLRAARRAVVDARMPNDVASRALADAARVLLPADLQGAMRRADRVVAVLPADLAWVPLEALPLTSDAGPLDLATAALGCLKPLERAPSLSVRARFGERRSAGDRVLVVDSARHAETEAAYELQPLQFAAREAALVARAYPQRTVRLTGAAATGAGLREALAAGPFDLVHISAHAVEDPRVPTSSLLALADGPAAVPALCGLPLDGAFVVLSACSSAVGDALRGGEGAMALLAWPCAAGGRGAAAALWPVNQQATADLLGRFHHERALLGGDEAEAMRRARVALAATPQYGHPHHWAGFAVYAGATEVPAAGFGRRGLAVLLALAGLAALRFALSPRAAGRRRSSAAAARR